MTALGPHGAFILAAYAAVAITLTGLIGWLWWDGLRHARRLRDLEARGLGRGSRFKDSAASRDAGA